MTDLFVADKTDTPKTLTPRQRDALTNSIPPEPAVSNSVPIPVAPLNNPQVNPVQPQPQQYNPVSQQQYPPHVIPPAIDHDPSTAHFRLGHPFEGQQRNAIPLFASFWQNPQGVYFDTQEVDEHILLFLRKHFITNIGWVFMAFLFALLPFGVSIFLKMGTVSIPFPPEYIRIFIYMYYIFIATYAFIEFLGWYFNISLITAKRILDIELADLVYKKISATKISLVQDIAYEQTGTIWSIFNFGDVLIQTAGTQDNFYVHSVPKPDVVVRVVEDMIGKADTHIGGSEKNEQ